MIVSHARVASRPAGKVLNITSHGNPRIKAIRALAQIKNRRESGLFLAEGLKLVTDGLDKGWRVQTLVYRPEAGGNAPVAAVAARARARGADILAVNDSILAKIARRDNPQTVIGVFEQVFLPESEIRPSGLWIALERIRDPGNLGTIIRTGHAVGAAGIILVGPSVDPFSVDAVRATMGSVFHVPIARTSEAGLASICDQWTGMIVGTHLESDTDYRNIAYRDPVLLLMGGEQSGLSEPIAALCDKQVRIPMAGGADSLNVAVAAAVMLYEIRRDQLTVQPDDSRG